MMALIIILHGDIVHYVIRHGRFDGFFRSFHLDNGRSSVATTTATSRRLFGGFLVVVVIVGFGLVRLACRKGESTFAGRLDVRLVVATNPVANGNKVKGFGVNDIIVPTCQGQQLIRQPVIVDFCLMLEVLVAVGNQETFQLRNKTKVGQECCVNEILSRQYTYLGIVFPRKFLAQNRLFFHFGGQRSRIRWCR